MSASFLRELEALRDSIHSDPEQRKKAQNATEKAYTRLKYASCYSAVRSRKYKENRAKTSQKTECTHSECITIGNLPT